MVTKNAQGAEKNKKRSMKSSQLMELFEEQLKDIYWAEKALIKALPKMAKKASDEDLINALEEHLAETEEHQSRLEQVFKLIGKKATAKKCEAMSGLIEEGEEIMKDTEDGPMRDAGIIAAAQKVEHYEIATYGTLRQFAETLGLKDVEKILATTLKEEKAADEKLSKVATTAINVDAAEEKA
jgi:ferritin-like metal-binding protein YciE